MRRQQHDRVTAALLDLPDSFKHLRVNVDLVIHVLEGLVDGPDHCAEHTDFDLTNHRLHEALGLSEGGPAGVLSTDVLLSDALLNLLLNGLEHP